MAITKAYTLGLYGADSDFITSVVDSDYIVARASSFDSANALGLIDSDYIKTVQYLDDEKLYFGTGQDLKIYSDGSNSLIWGEGTSYLRGTSVNIAPKVGAGYVDAVIAGSSSVQIKHPPSNAVKLQTSTTGISVTGTVAATAFTGDGSALTGTGGAFVQEIDIKTADYTVVAGDLGKIIKYVGGNVDRTVTLTAGATLGDGFHVTILNANTGADERVVIDANGTERFGWQNGPQTITLSRGEMVRIIWDNTGGRWIIGEGGFNLAIRADVNPANTAAAGDGANSGVAIGHNAQAVGSLSVALGRSYASGTNSAAIAIADNTTSYGAQHTNSVAIGYQAVTTADKQIVLGDASTSAIIGGDLTLSGDIKTDTNTADLYIKTGGTLYVSDENGHTNASFTDGGASVLYNAHMERLRTNSTGLDVTGIITTDGLTSSADLNITGSVNADSATIPILSGNITMDGVLRGPSTFTIDPAAHGDNTGTLVVAGNLQVDGTTTTVNSTTVTINDKTLVLGDGSTTDSQANGTAVVFGGQSNAASIYYTSATDTIGFGNIAGISVPGTVTATGGAANNDNSAVVISANSTQHAKIKIDTSSTGNHRSTLALESGSYEVNIATSGLDEMRFSTSNTSDALFIGSNGNIGIGHTGPDEKLDVKGNFTLRDTTGNLAHGMSVFGDDDQYAIFNQESNGDGGLRITTLSDASSATSAFQLNAVATTPSTDGNNAAIRLRAAKKSGSTETALASNEDVLSIGNTGTELVVVKGSGNVGIGTTIPQQLLHIHNSSGDFGAEAVLTGRLSAGTPKAEVAFKRGTSGDGAMLVLRSSNSSGGLIDAVTIKDGTGNVGIGTTSPNEKLHIQSAVVSGKHLDLVSDLLVEGTDTRFQIMASDAGGNGSAMILSTEDHHWIHHAHATSASNMYSLGYYNSTATGFDGAQNSSEIFNITTGGNVSIGSTFSPGAALVVDGAGGQDTSGSTMVLYDNRTTAADVGGSIMFSFDWNGTNGHLGSGPFIKGYKVNASTTDYSSGLKFGTRKNGVGNNAIAMTINEDQNVGIGVQIPEAKLHVEGTSSGTATYIENNFSWTAANMSEFSNSAFTIRPRNSDTYLKTSGSASDIRFQGTNAANNASRDILLNPFGGKVGIGVTTPSNRLEVNTSNGSWRVNDYGGMYFHNTSDPNNERYFHGRSTGDLSIGYVPIANLTGGAGGYASQTYDQITILADGKVGIGTTSPTKELEIKNDSPSGNTGIVIHNNSASHAAHINLKGGRTGTGQDVSQLLTTNGSTGITNIRGTTDGNATSGRLEFWTGASGSLTNKMTIQSNGYIRADQATQVRLKLGSTGSVDNNTGNWIRGNGSNFGFNTPGNYSWEVSGGEKMELSSTGHLSLNDGYFKGGDADGTGGSLLLAQRYGSSDDLIATIGTLYSSGALHLGYGMKPKNGSSGFVSTYDNFSGKRTGLELSSTAMNLRYASAQQTAVGSDITALQTPFSWDIDDVKYTITKKITTGNATMMEFHYFDEGGDLGNGDNITYVDFKFTDGNINNTPQVQIGAQSGNPGHTDEGQISEGRGNFVVRTNNGAASGTTIRDTFRVEWDGSIHTPFNPAALFYDIPDVQTVTNGTVISFGTAAGFNRGITANSSKYRFTVSADGIYSVHFTVSGSVNTSNAGDGIRIVIHKNGSIWATTDAYNIETTGSAAGQEYSFTQLMLVDCNIDDYLELKWSNVGGADFSARYGSINIHKVS